jgi:hypothetical protein
MLPWLLALAVPASAVIGPLGWRARNDALMLGAATGCLVFLVAALIGFAVQRKQAAYAEYMADCQRHRPGYECTLLWKAAENRGASGDPVIIPVPTVR